MKHTIILLIFVICAISFCTEQAQAIPIIIEITGEVKEIRDLEAYPYQEIIHEGDTFTGIYTYDSATTDSSSSSDIGRYVQDSPYGFDVSLGGFEFKTADSHVGQFGISLYDNYSTQPYDRYLLVSHLNVPLSTGIPVYSIAWDLYDDTHSAISSVVLPTSAPIISEWPSNELVIGCGGDPGGNHTLAIWGAVTEAVLVPEPLTGMLVAIGVFFLRRR